MKKNMGFTDKLIRLVLAITFAVLYYTKLVEGTVGIILLVIGGIFFLTSLASFCPLYSLIGVNSCKKK